MRVRALLLGFACGAAGNCHAIPHQASAAWKFTESVEIAVRFEYGDTVYSSKFDEVKLALVDLGVRHICTQGCDASTKRKIRQLAASGIRTTLQMDPNHGIVPNDLYWTPAGSNRQLLSEFVTEMGSAIEAVEMPSELDIFYNRTWVPAFRWRAGDDSDANLLTGSSNDTHWWGYYIKAWTADSYAALKDDPFTRSVEVIGPALGQIYDPGRLPLEPGVFDRSCDWANFHVFPGQNSFSVPFRYAGVEKYLWQGGQPSAKIGEAPYVFQTYLKLFHGKPIQGRVAGYHTGTSADAIGEAVQAKYAVRTFLEFFKAGISRCCYVELADYTDNPSAADANQGLLKNNLLPKPAFLVLRALLSTLRDIDGSFEPGSLDYSLKIDPPPGYERTQYVHDLLLEKKDGSYWLILWHEIANSIHLGNGPARELRHPAIPAHIALRRPPHSIRIHRLDGGATRTLNVAALNSEVLSVTDLPTILEIVP